MTGKRYVDSGMKMHATQEAPCRQVKSNTAGPPVGPWSKLHALTTGCGRLGLDILVWFFGFSVGFAGTTLHLKPESTLHNEGRRRNKCQPLFLTAAGR